MKSMFTSLFVFAAFVFSAATSSADNAPKLVETTFTKVYVPDGFDDNDNVQIVAEGTFSNGCYRYANTEVKFDAKNKTITLNPSAYKYSGMCLTVILPFDGVIDVGLLKKGVYKIFQSGNKIQLGELNVRETATPAADDYLYAPINQAFFESKDDGNRVLITGNFPVSCMKIKEVQTHVQADVLVLLPIAELDKSVICTQVETPFKTSVDAASLKNGRILIHVRSMNGKSVNSLVDVP